MTRRSFLAGIAAAGAVACGGNVTDVGDTAGGGGASTSTNGDGGAANGASNSTSTGGAPAPEPTSPATSSNGVAAARFVVKGPDTDAVALTFHTNGSLAIAQKILDTFSTHGAVFTSFIVGDWLAANPSWARKLLDGGHELANHTYTHPDFAALSRSTMVDEITKCRDTIRSLAGDGGRFFRPSGTDDGTATPSEQILEVAAAAGYDTVLGWDDEPYDYRDPGSALVQSRVLDQLKRGSIVSLHFGHQGTADALPGILEGIKAKGLRTVTVKGLLGR